VRRQMELSCSMQAGGEDTGCSQHLAELDSLYARLEHLSSSLHSPYLEESLPLALQHALQPWQGRLPLETQLPYLRDVEPIEHTRLLIALTQTLLKHLAAAAPPPQGCVIALTQQHQGKELRYHITYEATPSTVFAQELSTVLTPFLETFQIFTGGEYEQFSPPQTLGWVLSWSSTAES